MASKVPEADAEDDDELSDLLDSALDDFNKHMTVVGAAAPPPSALGLQATATSGDSTKADSTLSPRDGDASAIASSSLAAAAGASDVTSAATAKTPDGKAKRKKNKKTPTSSSAAASSSFNAAASADSADAEEWVRAFNDELKLAQQEFGSAMGQFSDGDPEFTAQFERMMKGLESAGGDGAMPFPNMFGGPPPGAFQPAAACAGASSAAPGAAMPGASLQEQLAQTVSGLQENLKSSADVKANSGDDDFMKLFQQQMAGAAAGAGSGEGSGLSSPSALDGTGLIPMMETMMQTLLSQDVLYPSVKELSSKLQDWLVRHNDDVAVSAEDRTRFTRQLDILRSVCCIYELNDDSDTDATKKERYESVLQLMQQMQEYGHPPEEVMKELAPDMKLDGTGGPSFPGLPPLAGMGMPFPPGNGQGEQCRLM